MWTTHIKKYGTNDIVQFLNDVDKYSIGMDEWMHRFTTKHESHANYPPYNLVKETSIDFKLEIALAGYKREDIEVYSEWNKLFVDVKKSSDDDLEYVHRGLARRAFTRTWTLSDDVVIDGVDFVDGLLTIKLKRVIPEHQKKKVYSIGESDSVSESQLLTE